MAKRRKKAHYRKARKTALTPHQRARRKHYMANRRKILNAARKYYKANRAKIRRQQARYRKIVGRHKPRKTFASMGRAGGRYRRFKPLKRLNKYRFIVRPKRKGRRRRRA